MSIEDRLLEAVDGMHAAAIDQAGWGAVLPLVTDLLGGGSANLQISDSSAFDDPHLTYHNLDDPGDYASHYWKVDPRLAALVNFGFPGVLHDYQHITESEMDRSEFYEWCQGFGYRYYCSLNAHWINGQAFSITVQRSQAQGPVSDETLRYARLLSKQFRGAARTAIAVNHHRSETLLLENTFEQLPYGAVVLGSGGKVIKANGTAVRIADGSDGLLLGKDGLSLRHPSEQTKYARLLSQSLSPDLPRQLDEDNAMSVRRPSGRRPYVLTFSTMAKRHRDLTSEHQSVLLIITDLDAEETVNTSALKSIYGLTDAESRLAVDLCKGATLDKISQERGKSRETLKKQLGAVFVKTNTSRQAELVALLSQIPKNKLVS